MICIIDSENVSAQWACALRACVEPFVLEGGKRGERNYLYKAMKIILVD